MQVSPPFVSPLSFPGGARAYMRPYPDVSPSRRANFGLVELQILQPAFVGVGVLDDAVEVEPVGLLAVDGVEVESGGLLVDFGLFLSSLSFLAFSSTPSRPLSLSSFGGWSFEASGRSRHSTFSPPFLSPLPLARALIDLFLSLHPSPEA